MILKNLWEFERLFHVLLLILCSLLCIRFWIIFNKVPVYEAIDSYFVWRNGDIAVECYDKVCEVKVPEQQEEWTKTCSGCKWATVGSNSWYGCRQEP